MFGVLNAEDILIACYLGIYILEPGGHGLKSSSPVQQLRVTRKVT